MSLDLKCAVDDVIYSVECVEVSCSEIPFPPFIIFSFDNY